MYKNIFKYDDMKRSEHMAVRTTVGWYFWTHQLLEVTGPDQANILQNLYASMFPLIIGSIIFYLIAHRENMMFFIPLCTGTVTLYLWKATPARIFPLLGMAILLIHAFSFVYIVAMALSIGALGLVLLVAFYNLIIVIPLAHAYLTDTTSNQIP